MKSGIELIAEKGQKFEEIVSTLEDAWNSIDEAVGSINEAIE